ncbi:MAG: hypothetical protein HUJ30_00710 [Gammaproteobacteria bacterium]|nr:hypothetical protein [Gammaproteobacteria bacterium]
MDNCEELIEIAERMSQELQDFIDEGINGGRDMSGPQALLDEWNAAYSKSQGWQAELANFGDARDENLDLFKGTNYESKY